jgi:hypothetical protein
MTMSTSFCSSSPDAVERAASRSFGRLSDVIGGEAIELAILSKPDSLRTVFDRE